MSETRVRRVLIIDDHPLLRKGLRQLVDFNPEFEIVGETDNGEQGLTMVREIRPDLVLLDLYMPGMKGHEVLKALKQMEPAPKVVILTVSDTEEDIFAALRGGADGYLLKDTDPEDLLDKLHELTEGRLALSPRIADCLGRAVRSGGAEAERSRPGGLTKREREILIHISEGESNKMIGRKLHIAEATVKVHVKHLLKKLGLNSRVDAAVWVVTHKHEL